MLKTVILAGGKGTRMKSKLPKVLHKIYNRNLIDYVIDISEKVGSEETIIVVGYESELVKSSLSSRDVKFSYQAEQLGTGHAVMMAKEYLKDDGHILILCGDCPLMSEATIKDFIEYHMESDNDVTGISVILNNPTGYGRIIRDNANFCKIVEEKDATYREKTINEVNVGVYCFKTDILKNVLDKLGSNNAQNEYYLTDALELVKNDGGQVGIMIAEKVDEFLGINSKVQLEEATKILQNRINTRLMENGVIIEDINTTYISRDVQIGIDTIIKPNTIIDGDTIIGEDCIIGPNSNIKSCVLGNNISINNSVMVDSKVMDGTTIGPFAYIRPNSNIGKNVKIGDFVEVKNSNIGDNTKASHLTYIGDADLGSNINLGCGTITVNYDGENKARTVIEDNVFVGCNSNLIAPLKLEKGAYVAAATTVTRTVPAESLVIGRVRQEVKNNWKSKN